MAKSVKLAWLRALAGFLLVCTSSSVMAVTWQQQINVPVSVDYDTNPLMQETNITAIWKSSFNPQYTVTGIQDFDRWSADITLHIERNSDQSIAMNREDPALGLGWQHEFERGQVGVKLGYDESSSRATTLEETGRASGVDTTRVNKSISADLQYFIAEKWTITSSVNASRMTFQGGEASTSSAGSRSYAASAAVNYSYSEYLQPYLQLTANRSEPDDALSPATNVYGAVVGANWNLLERLNLGANWGYNQVTGASSDRGGQAAGNLSYLYDKSSLTMTMSRSISPSGNGGFISSDQLTGGWRYALTERSNTGIDVSMRKNNGSGKSETDQFSAWYARDLSPNWNLRFSYLYKQTSTAIQQAHGNVLGLSFGYNFSEF